MNDVLGLYPLFKSQFLHRTLYQMARNIIYISSRWCWSLSYVVLVPNVTLTISRTAAWNDDVDLPVKDVRNISLIQLYYYFAGHRRTMSGTSFLGNIMGSPSGLFLPRASASVGTKPDFLQRLNDNSSHSPRLRHEGKCFPA